MLKKLAIPAPLFIATVAVVWAGLNLPPPLWIVKYGLTPGCEPTGEIIQVEGIEFVVIGPGIALIGSSWLPDRGEVYFMDGDLLGRTLRSRRLGWGRVGIPSDEMPVHWVEIPEGLALARTEITNAQYEAWKPDHERSQYSPGDNDPIVNLSWDEAQCYCAWLSEESGREIRLPSESEWEAACRAGTRTEYYFGDDEERLEEYAWFDENSPNGVHEVGKKKANAWGFHDLHGNVWEWCEDIWHESYLLEETMPGPDGPVVEHEVYRAPPDGSTWLTTHGPAHRVVRGGAWVNSPEHCRSAVRRRASLGYQTADIGIRPALTQPRD